MRGFRFEDCIIHLIFCPLSPCADILFFAIRKPTLTTQGRPGNKFMRDEMALWRCKSILLDLRVQKFHNQKKSSLSNLHLDAICNANVVFQSMLNIHVQWKQYEHARYTLCTFLVLMVRPLFAQIEKLGCNFFRLCGFRKTQKPNPLHNIKKEETILNKTNIIANRLNLKYCLKWKFL